MPWQYRILSLDIFRPPLSLIHSFSPHHDRHYCSLLMCPTTEDKVCRDKWAPKIQHYFTDCFFWFWCIKWVGDVGMQDAEQLLARPAGWRRFSLSLKGDYEGENVEPNDRKVSWCIGWGLTHSQESQPEESPVGIWMFLPRSHRKCCKKALNAKQFREKKCFTAFKFAWMWNECSVDMYKLPSSVMICHATLVRILTYNSSWSSHDVISGQLWWEYAQSYSGFSIGHKSCFIPWREDQNWWSGRQRQLRT